MNYCRYKQSNGYILEISKEELFPVGEFLVCLTSMEYVDTHDMYVLEINENNELIAHRGYLKGV
jgi:hypothetical protein